MSERAPAFRLCNFPSRQSSPDSCHDDDLQTLHLKVTILNMTSSRDFAKKNVVARQLRIARGCADVTCWRSLVQSSLSLGGSKVDPVWRYSPSPGSRHMHSDITRQHHPPPPGCPPLAVSSRLFPKSSIVRCLQDLLYNPHRPIVVELLTPKLQAPTRHRQFTAPPLIAA